MRRSWLASARLLAGSRALEPEDLDPPGAAGAARVDVATLLDRAAAAKQQLEGVLGQGVGADHATT